MNDDAGIFRWALDHAWAAVLALLALVWRQQGAAMKDASAAAAKDLEAHGKEDERQFNALHEEQKLQRAHIAKLFDRIEEQGRRSEDRHVELLNALHEGLRTKADR